MKNRSGPVFESRVRPFGAPQVVVALYSRKLLLRSADERATVECFNRDVWMSHRIRFELITDVEIVHLRIRNRRMLFDMLHRVKLTLIDLRLRLVLCQITERKLDASQ